MDYQQIKKVSGIYRIINQLNQKHYTGSAVNLRRRAYEHFSALRRGVHFNQHLQRSYHLHGESQFIFKVLEECPANELIERESYYIRQCHGYNTEHPCATWLGRKHTPETIAKIREARSRQVISPEVYAKIAQSMRGKKMNFSAEVLQKLSEKSKGMDRSYTQTKEFRAKMSSAVRGQKRGRKIFCPQTNQSYINSCDAARQLGLSNKVIWKVLKGLQKSYRGFTFSYIA